jgi:hypothetical protein
MRLLLDEHLPIGLSAELQGHAVDTVSGRGWTGIKNGELLRRMSSEYDVLVTMDRSIEFQQRISNLDIAFRHCARSCPIQPHAGSEAARAVDPLRPRRGQAWPHSPSRLLTKQHRSAVPPVTSFLVRATVVSRPTADRAIVDAGLKALAFDSGPPLVCDEPAATYERANVTTEPWSAVEWIADADLTRASFYWDSAPHCRNPPSACPVRGRAIPCSDCAK